MRTAIFFENVLRRKKSSCSFCLSQDAFPLNAFLCRVKVLILHQHFKTPHGGGAIRSYYLAKALVDKGVHTVVITGHSEAYRVEHIDGIEVHYLSVPYNNRFGFSRRVYSFFQFVFKASKLAALHKDARICYAISTPLTTGLVAMRIRRRYKIPYVFEVGDLWPDAPIQLGFIRNKALQHVAYRMESAIYKGAKSLVALSPAIRDVLTKKIPGKAIYLIPNMADTDFFKPEDKRPELEEKFGVHGKFVISYIGAIGVANGLHYLLNCAEACQRERLSVHFLLCGDGAMLDNLKNSVINSALQNVTFVPFQNRNGIGEIMNVTDAAFICYQPLKILETGSPNKYFDALAAGKLILINFGGWIKEETEKEACGVYMKAEEANDIVKKIGPFITDPALLKRYQSAGRSIAERKYSRVLLGQRFWEIISG